MVSKRSSRASKWNPTLKCFDRAKSRFSMGTDKSYMSLRLCSWEESGKGGLEAATSCFLFATSQPAVSGVFDVGVGLGDEVATVGGGVIVLGDLCLL